MQGKATRQGQQPPASCSLVRIVIERGLSICANGRERLECGKLLHDCIHRG
jgi:hypothetical protein